MTKSNKKDKTSRGNFRRRNSATKIEEVSDEDFEELESDIKAFNVKRKVEKRPLIKNLLNIEDFYNASNNPDSIQKLISDYKNKIELNESLSETYANLKRSNQVNGWNEKKTKVIKEWRNDLEYRWVVNYFFVYELKTVESMWSWVIIVISTITSTISLINVDSAYNIYLSVLLTIFSVTTTLIAAWLKKQNYVERIKEIDRYIQKIGVIHTEIEYILTQRTWDRIKYNEFIDRYQKELTDLRSSSPPMSPEEYKTTIYKLTRYYPELVSDMFPWYNKAEEFGIEYYKMTNYGKDILETYENNNFSCISCCIRCYNCFFCNCNCVSRYQIKFRFPEDFNYKKIEELRILSNRRKSISISKTNDETNRTFLAENPQKDMELGIEDEDSDEENSPNNDNSEKIIYDDNLEGNIELKTKTKNEVDDKDPNELNI